MATDPNDAEHEFIAYHGSGLERVRIVSGARWREWMNATEQRFANRCLPLLMANEAGWALLNPVGLTATWAGGPHTSDVTIQFDALVARRPPAESNFGYGIITWSVPLLFRTPPGYNLLARGPVNLPKDGASALEGLVETDCAVTTFTMNWQLTRPGHPVRFEEGEPFCMLVPQRRGELESFRPVHRDLSAAPQIRTGLKVFRTRRDDLQKRKFIADFIGRNAKAWDEWEATYFRGRHPDGTPFPDHQTKLRLREFADERARPTERSVHAELASPGSTVEADSLPEHVLNATFTLSRFIRYRPFRTVTVVLDLENALHFELNEVAGRMFDLLAGSWTIRATADVVAREYGQSVEVVQRDLAALSAQLVELGLLLAGSDPLGALSRTS